MRVRFDDSLNTVLSSDMRPGVGAQAAWRQLVDLAGRGRVPTDEPVIARLRMLRDAVPEPVRAASARALAHARPDARLVGLFAEDVPGVAAPVLRAAELDTGEWLELLPRLTPQARAVLRHRRDLAPEVERGLESLGAVDYVLPRPEAQAEDAPEPEPEIPAAPLSPTPFVALGEVARSLPVVAEARARAEAAEPVAANDGFAISDLVARIEAYRRNREEVRPAAPQPASDGFSWESDATGVLIGVEGVDRGALVGLSIAHAGQQGLAQVDGVAAGGYRRRSPFADARLEVGGTSSAAGAWRLSGVPAFDPASGRFTGFRGTARRPRADEVAAPRATPSADSLRQLVHELRTPANAISGFAELIETELLGPVSPVYRERAGAIRQRAADLITAIEDLDTAARLEAGALSLRPGPVPLVPLVARALDDLAPLASLRGVRVELDAGDAAPAIFADDRAAERLVGRLLATLIAAGGPGERLRVGLVPEPGAALMTVAVPRALADLDERRLFALDAEGSEPAGAPLLGTGFALRVARNLAAELGGALLVAGGGLTLRLPTVLDRAVEHATTP
jgi:signal transduction histidine kinase